MEIATTKWTAGAELPGVDHTLSVTVDDPKELTQCRLHLDSNRQVLFRVCGPPDAIVDDLRTWTKLIEAKVVSRRLELLVQVGSSAGWGDVDEKVIGGWTKSMLVACQAELNLQLDQANRQYLKDLESWLSINAGLRRAAMKVEPLENRVAYLESRWKSLVRSRGHRAARALSLAARSPKEALRLGRRIYNLRRPSHPEEAAREERRQQRRQQLDVQWSRYVENVRQARVPEIVLMFSGTTFIQPLRANRPIRLTRVLLERGAPCIFSYHGRLDEKETPTTNDVNLFEAPIEYTETKLAEMARTDFGTERRILIVSYPHLAVARQIGIFEAEGWGIVYDCRDEWEAFHEVGMASWYDKATEAFVVNQVDHTFCVSGPLRDKMQSMTTTRPVDVSPNAYDPNFLAAGYKPERSDQVIAGYFGHLSDRWFDWESLALVAKAKPHICFEIIGHLGPANPSVPDNVVLLGPKTHPEICEIAKRWHLGIIPFRVGTLSDGVDPIKIYEYFALGLSVLSFRMPQINDYPYTTTVETTPAFIDEIDRVAAQEPEPAVLEEFLRNNRWSHRLDQLLEGARAGIAKKPATKSWGRSQ